MVMCRHPSSQRVWIAYGEKRIWVAYPVLQYCIAYGEKMDQIVNQHATLSSTFMNNSTLSYRYPGSSPFQDTEYDRRLFFGREEEARALFHLTLAENLVVLFAKSGMGKTSLLNAGVLQLLREQHFIPLKVRFNDPERDPLQTVYQSIQDLFTLRLYEVKGIEYVPGQARTLWQYFKTAEFWSANNKLLTPLLVLDQFEDFFDVYSANNRQAFILQFADVVRGRIPTAPVDAWKKMATQDIATETPPNVKTIIVIREDYLGQLEELSREIPAILHKRFRLTALTRRQAQDAIVKPAQVRTEEIKADSFKYKQPAIRAMLDFLCKRKERDKVVITNEVEPFQLQLLCQHVEKNIVSAKAKAVQEPDEIIIQETDLGGETGMQQVLQDFYDDQINALGSWWQKHRVRKLCEKGLISPTTRRLSLEEEDITRRFKVHGPLLNDLVNRRLLRAEPRVGSVYYELSHDALLEPIRSSQKRRKVKQTKVNRIISLGILFFIIVYIYIWQKHYIYNFWGNISYKQGKYEKAVEYYQKAIEFNPNLAYLYSKLGDALRGQGKADKAIEQYQKALELAPNDVPTYNKLGNAFSDHDKYAEAMNYYQKAIAIASNYVYAYNGLGNTLLAQQKYSDAMTYYQQAIALDPNYVYAYNGLGNTLLAQQKYSDAMTYYQQAIALDPEFATAYYNLGNALYKQQKYSEAMTHYQQAIALDPEFAAAYYNLGVALYNRGQYAEAFPHFQKVIELRPSNVYDKMNLARLYLIAGYVQEAATLSQEILQTLQIDPDGTLAMRFITITALLLQTKRTEALTEIHELLRYYQGLSEEYQRGWSYGSVEQFLNTTDKLPDADKTLLLKLIDILEAPKPEGDQKLKELEAALGEMFKP